MNKIQTVECDQATESPRTLRDRLKQTIIGAKDHIKFLEKEIKKSEGALEILDKNKELETLVNLMRS